MNTLLSAALILHPGIVPHIHPHEAAVAFGLGLGVVLFVGAAVALLKRKPAAR
jgi:hypothetical protein